ncbi:multidrug transporter [Natrinema salsiterrestre]|uniref:multidrug transporter n=1 Tax=Natrinema salsiterrestre TaxID=2950540 RepID=UPI002406A5CD|nr:multidrug transporter [Natrinema salsiterrestre]
MVFHRGSSIGTVLGVLVMVIAIIGTVFLDWTWSNPDGEVLPLVIGGVAAVAGGLVVIQRFRN